MTDPHLFADKAGRLRGLVTYDSLQKVVKQYQSQSWRADLVVLTGDIVQDDSAAAYRHCRLLLSGLELPVHCTPGNHDIRSLMRDALSDQPFSYCGAVEYGNWFIVGIDSCCAGRAGGRISDDELGRLENVLASSDAAHILVYLHHPPVPMGSKWLDAVGLENGDELLQRMQSAGRIRLAIFGHVHQAYDADHGNVRIIATPSTCRQFLPGSDTFALDDKPPAYRRINLHANGRVDTDLVWVDDA